MKAKRNSRSKVKETPEPADKSLSVALARYRILFEKSQEAMLISTPEGTIEEANDAGAALFGLTPQSIRSRRSADLYVNPADRQAIVEKLNLGQPVRDHAVTLRHAGGSAFEALISTQLIAVPGVTGARYLSIVRDQTRERMAQQAIRESNTLLHEIIDTSTSLIYVLDTEGRFVLVNRKAESVLGVSREKLIGKTRDAFLPKEVAAGHRSNDREVMRTGQPMSFEEENPEIDGKHTYLSVKMPLTNAGGSAYALCGISTDITARKRAEEELRTSEERFRIATESITDVIYEWDLKESITWFGDVDRVLGYPAGVFPRTLDGWVATLHPEDKERVWMAVEEQLKGAAPYNVEYRIQGKDGVWYWWSARGTVIKNERGEPCRWIGAVTDVTDRKRADLKLREREARYRTLVENIPQKILMKDRNFRWVSINENLARDFGFRPEEVVGKMDADLFTPELAAKYHSDDVRIMETGKTEELEEKYIVAGKETWVNTIKTPIRGENGEIEGVLGVFWDITERKRAESELRRYLNQLSLINRLDHVISSTFEIEEVYDALVSEMRQLFQFDRTALIAINDDGTEWQIVKQWTCGESAFVPKIWRRSEDSVIDWMLKNKRTYVEDRIGQNEKWPETDLLRKEGISSRVLVPLVVKGNIIGVMTLASKNSNAYSKPDVQILESLADQVGISMHNARMYGKVREFAATLEKRVEDRTAQLELANKELESFAYSVSHDLRAPLRHINGFIELLGKDAGSGVSEKSARYLHIISDAAKQMGELIDDLLTFSRMAREEMRKTSLNPASLVNDVVASLKNEIEGRTVRWIIHDLPMVTADPAMLKLVFVNLISNAQKFTRTRDVAEIEVGTIPSDGNETIFFVKDNGVGFDMEYVHKLFGVFHRLHSKDEFEGTGIGLANVRRIISRHGGRTWAEGTVGVGASFYFSLPTTT